MTFADQLNVPAFLETVARQCISKHALTKQQLIKLALEDARGETNDVEVDKFLADLVKAGHLRTSGGRFWTPKKAEQ
jgi:hypothetical protein